MIDDAINAAKLRMQKALDALQHELSRLRTGRAHPSILEHVMVPYYGNDTPLSQVATINVGDARTLTVTPWEKTLMGAIEKAIIQADLGLNPANSGDMIRVPLPALTEERRRDLAKVVKAEGENAKVSIRNARRDANQQLKDAVKAKELTEDDERRGQDRVQKVTDQFIADADKILADKETEIMAV
ncbi:MAG: ribosome-recycling factor [marine bacterium B5-7]|nr:MAG: ribosome-recycling factor [marine bacterium B5-7]